MNAIKKIIHMNEKELEQNVSDAASWHADYNDTSYIYIGNLHQDLKEEDILSIFSQYGNPTHLNLIKEKETGKSRGFCYLKYEDHRSCILAIDNFNGVKIYERPLKIDHTYFRLLDGQSEDEFLIEYPEHEKEGARKVIKDSVQKLLPLNPEPDTGVDDDFSDPIAAVLKVKDDDFSDPMTLMKLLGDDNLDDPMATYLSKSSECGETQHKEKRRHKSRSHHDSSRPSKHKRSKTERV